MRPAKKKRPVLNFLKRVFGNAAVRGTAKAFPVGGWLYEVVAVLRHLFDPGKRGQPLPHSPVSLLVQLVWLSLILYGVCSKQIPVTEALDYFDFSADDFKYFFAATPDTLQ